MVLGLKSGLQIAAKTGIPAGLLLRQIWYSVWKSGVLGITEYRQGRPLMYSIKSLSFKAGLYRSLYGVHNIILGDSGVDTLGDTSAFVNPVGHLLLTRWGNSWMNGVGIVFEFYIARL